QDFFRLQLEGLRERVKPLAARIRQDMPGYTVHDISHLDALWEIASLIVPKELNINPAEAFVLGGAILLHDAGMTLAAYPEGLAELKKTTVWSDVLALHELAVPNDYIKNKIPADIERQVAVEVLRRLHAEKAAELAIQGWKDPTRSEDRRYLIESEDV